VASIAHGEQQIMLARERTAVITSETSAQRAIARGQRSIIPLYSLRAVS